MTSFRTSVLTLCLAALLAPAAFAATYFVPTDAELIQKSDDIVVATGVSSLVTRNAHGAIVTRYLMRVEESLKGRRFAGEHLVLTERGGMLDGQITYIPGTPAYEPDVRYLIFTETNRDMEPVTFGMALGQFHYASEGGRALLLRTEIHGFNGNFDGHVERARDAEGFVAYVRGIVAQNIDPEPSYFVDGAEPEFHLKDGKIGSLATRTSYLLQDGSGQGFRWSTPSTSFVKAGTAVGYDGNGAVSQAFAEWNGAAASISYGDGGQDDSANKGFTQSDGKDAILFNDPNGEVGSAAGIGGISSGGAPYTLDGETFWNMLEVDVVMNDTQNFPQQTCMNSVMTHEVGHTLGFRHSDQPPAGGVSTSTAIMNSVVQCGWNGVLKDYDLDAASTVYGTGPVCNPPTIPGSQPADKSVTVGTATSLSVTPGGTGPFTYQWFFGTAPDTSSPVSPGGTSSSLNITPNSVGSGQYWVRVGHSCSGATANSRTATVTATCTNPSITGQSSSRSISAGQSTQLSVTASGSGLSYQWYRGTAPDTSTPAGNASSLTVSPSETTSYWVRVSGLCGSPVDSNTIVVTVVPCAETTVEQPTATVAPGGPGKYTLSVVATSTATPLSYAWFKGGVPGFGGTSAGTGQSISVTVTAATLYWVRVTNSCGRISFSPGITVAACTLPTIGTQPNDQSINFGQSATLSIVPSSGTTVKWYRGAVGDTSAQIGTGNSVVTPTLTATTQFWAQVTNSCGSISSRQVTVTVQQITDLVTLLNDRFFVIVNYVNQFENPPQTGKLLGRSLFETSTSETAIFTFGDPLVVELMVRVSDARPFENKIHVYLGGLSDVEFSVVIADSLTGIVNEYKKPPNQLVGVIDRITFPATNSLGSAVDALMAQTVTRGITPQAEVSTINLLNNRFQVRMRYRNQFENPAQTGYLNARSIATSPTTETAVFFFGENVGSVEWMVRFSDARPFAERIDLFHGGLSDVEFTIEVLDTKTGAFKEYQKPPFSLNGLVDRDSYKP